MVIAGRRVNLWIWWSIGWTLTATLMLTRLRFRPMALVLGLVIGALLPRALVYCERWSLARRFCLALATLASMITVMAIGPWHVPRIVGIVVFLGGPPLVAGLLMSGFLPRAQPFVRRGMAMVIAFSALIVALSVVPGVGPHRMIPARILTHALWPVAVAALAVIPPRRWRTSSEDTSPEDTSSEDRC